jgi:hypothetical protein
MENTNMNTETRKSAFRTVAIFATVLAGVVVAERVYAGARSSFGVTVNTSTRSAQGHMGGAFNTTNTVEFIGCTIGTSASSNSIFCTARNSSGTQITCNVSAADHDRFAKVVAAIDSDSFLTMEWNTSNICTRLEVANHSFYVPKLHP